jgi:hypothetical protein
MDDHHFQLALWCHFRLGHVHCFCLFMLSSQNLLSPFSFLFLTNLCCIVMSVNAT